MGKFDIVIRRARRMGRVKNGFVLCDNCDNPADGELSLALDWTSCAPCVYGEADSFDEGNLIPVPNAQEGE